MAEKRKRISRQIWTRSGIILCVFALVACAVILKLARLQLIDYEYYKELVVNEITVETEVNPERGTIYDSTGNILATNKTVYLCFISPQDIIDAVKDAEAEKEELSKKAVSTGADFEDPTVLKPFKTDKGEYGSLPIAEGIARFLSDTLDVEYAEVLEDTAKNGRRYEEVKDKIDEEDAEKIRRFISDNDLTRQIYLRAGAIRYYPYSELAAHVIGLTNSDGVGTYGLEAYYNNLLEGTSGRYVTAQDALNNEMGFEYETFIEAEDGYNIKTTIDTYIQYELENQLNQTVKDNLARNRATGIVMNVKTGAVLAMATAPGFDCNAPYELDELSLKKLADYETSDEREEDALEIAKNRIKTDNKDLDPESEEFNAKAVAYYKENHAELYETAYNNKRFELIYAMWKNKAITELYEPGSTSKVMTTAMVFEEGVVSPSDTFTCTGALKVDGYPSPIGCHERRGHGTVTYKVGLQQSCNPTLMLASFRLGEEKFYNYFLNFGYGSLTGIDLPGEARGIISSRKDFGHVSLAVYSFGQTYKTTPIQQITAIASVANGGYLVTPHLLSEVVDDDGNVIKSYETQIKRQVVSTEVCTSISEILEDGVSGNGGAKNAYVRGYRIAAKTGTSEKRDIKDETLRVSSTVAYAPYDDPEIAVLIMVDEPMGGVVYGSRVAAPYVSKFLSNVLPYLGYEPQYTDDEMKTVDVSILNYAGYDLNVAKADIESRGLKWEVVGDGATVVSQVPPASSAVSKETGFIILYTGNESAEATVTVPDVEGKTGEAANRILVNAGLNVSIKGIRDSSSATVISQSIDAGEVVTKGTVIEISLVDANSIDD